MSRFGGVNPLICNDGYCSYIEAPPLLDLDTCPSSQIVSGLGRTTVSVSVVPPSGTAFCGKVSPLYSVSLNALSTATTVHQVRAWIEDTIGGKDSRVNCPTFTITIDSIAPVLTCPASTTVPVG